MRVTVFLPDKEEKFKVVNGQQRSFGHHFKSYPFFYVEKTVGRFFK